MDIAIDYVLLTFCIILFIDVKYKRFLLQQLWKTYFLFIKFDVIPPLEQDPNKST
jgi:hypothetical protein